MKHKTLLKRLKENGWNMKFDAREQALIEDIAEITEQELTGDRFKLSRKIRNKGAGVIGYIATKRNEAIKALEELRRQ